METFDFEELVLKISKMSKPDDKMVIGIDGADGAGKSALAKKIQKNSHVPLFHLMTTLRNQMDIT
jgi:chloramphenicol 3-O-phosphotransferase